MMDADDPPPGATTESRDLDAWSAVHDRLPRGWTMEAVGFDAQAAHWAATARYAGRIHDRAKELKGVGATRADALWSLALKLEFWRQTRVRPKRLDPRVAAERKAARAEVHQREAAIDARGVGAKARDAQLRHDKAERKRRSQERRKMDEARRREAVFIENARELERKAEEIAALLFPPKAASRGGVARGPKQQAPPSPIADSGLLPCIHGVDKRSCRYCQSPAKRVR